MPRWVKVMLLGMGVCFLAVGAGVGVFGARWSQTRVARLEQLRPLSAVGLDDQPAGAEALVVGTISPRNPAVFRDFVAYVREELDVTTDSDGDRHESWRSDGRETPRLVLEAGDGPLVIANESYSIEQGHKLWYDESTLGINDRPRDGSERYHGLLAGRPVTAYGTVVVVAEGNELEARTIFGGPHAEYLAAQRAGTSFLRIFGALFAAIGLLLCAIAVLFILRR